MPEVEYVIFHGQAPSGTGHRAAAGPFAFEEVQLTSRDLRIGGRTLLYQPAVRTVAGPTFDGAILGAELKMVANVFLYLLLKLRGRPVLLWGQGGEKDEDRGSVMGALGAAGALLKKMAARRADGYLAYTPGGRRRLIEVGVDPGRVFVVRNTLDVEAEVESYRRLESTPEAELRKELGLQSNSVVLVFIGRVYREKRLTELVALLQVLHGRGLGESAVEIVVIGDGPDLGRVRETANGLTGIHFIGEVRDRDAIARYMRVATALVIPGKVGLAVNHAFAHGVPVLTREGTLHAPEFEYLEPGRNSLIVAGGFDEFVAAVASFIGSPSQRAELAEGALRSREGLMVSSMAAAFHAAVCATLGVRP
jgi:glycosyltransferase involved in cell wall biosynthesis